jgi:hypothetical protein
MSTNPCRLVDGFVDKGVLIRPLRDGDPWMVGSIRIRLSRCLVVNSGRLARTLAWLVWLLFIAGFEIVFRCTKVGISPPPIQTNQLRPTASEPDHSPL